MTVAAKRVFSILVLLLVVLGSRATSAQADDALLRKTLEARYARMSAALRRGDTAAFLKVLTPNFKAYWRQKGMNVAASDYALADLKRGLAHSVYEQVRFRRILADTYVIEQVIPQPDGRLVAVGQQFVQIQTPSNLLVSVHRVFRHYWMKQAGAWLLRSQILTLKGSPYSVPVPEGERVTWEDLKYGRPMLQEVTGAEWRSSYRADRSYTLQLRYTDPQGRPPENAWLFIEGDRMTYRLTSAQVIGSDYRRGVVLQFRFIPPRSNLFQQDLIGTQYRLFVKVDNLTYPQPPRKKHPFVMLEPSP